MIEEDRTTISAMHSLGEAITYACGGRYDVAMYHLKSAMKELEMLQNRKELEANAKREAEQAVSA